MTRQYTRGDNDFLEKSQLVILPENSADVEFEFS